ncbi:NADP-dependent phosphogluconate dehydrogenase [Lactobacillus sp. ESL0731]|uniref:NADP-dependent phosphogluconate dehydrogenase n=1 Tax=unclassified Lactobacillus TaxID=2620435 RepID=UPI0023F9460B|nr:MULTISPECIES: NADP-dependent phosphogluconate dehydrogenase [unclassified Lactobacillus]WEV51141.1 NADP-dependent phosphogluconate dehydrogenase [Lactobacillus sp. ESL0700]WEV62269.1 NADP-dependent phosphogluconate dehydrogenase [Lactobacillus sp. ESL0731]
MQQFGIIGLSVMGKNLALNVRNSGFSVSGYSIDKPEVDAFAKYEDDKLKPTYSWEEFVNSLEKPRKILIQIAAGRPVDETLHTLLPLLDKGDILIDGGNSNFNDTNRRFHEMQEHGIHFIGMGVSGGEEGALNGPALMPGGDEEAYKQVAPILEAIAAKNTEGRPCVSFIGPEGSGHYVKMVHNGIEYGIMQEFSEVYDILRKVAGKTNEEMAQIFTDWNQGIVKAYLSEITAEVLKQKDELTPDHVIDHILNVASYKGTGNWMLEDAIRLGTPISVIAEAVLARFMSKATTRAGKEITWNGDVPSDLVANLGKALQLGQAVAYAQGFQQLKMAADAYKWDLRYPAIAQDWEAGCIIRSSMLKDIENAYENGKKLDNLFEDSYFKDLMAENIGALRQVIALATKAGIPTPTLSAALNYLESIFNPSLPANLIQGQRDYFGAHTYYRNDRPGVFHTEWYEEK